MKEANQNPKLPAQSFQDPLSFHTYLQPPSDKQGVGCWHSFLAGFHLGHTMAKAVVESVLHSQVPGGLRES